MYNLEAVTAVSAYGMITWLIRLVIVLFYNVLPMFVETFYLNKIYIHNCRHVDKICGKKARIDSYP